MKKIKLLIIEDDSDTEMFFKLFLGKKFDLKILNPDHDVIVHLQKYNYDIIIIDVSIRHEDAGMRIINELKSHSVFNKIPLIYLSAHYVKNEKYRIKPADVDIYLEKPVSNKTLVNTIHELAAARIDVE